MYDPDCPRDIRNNEPERLHDRTYAPWGPGRMCTKELERYGDILQAFKRGTVCNEKYITAFDKCTMIKPSRTCQFFFATKFLYNMSICI